MDPEISCFQSLQRLKEGSSHPLAEAIIERAKIGRCLDSRTGHPGKGVVAEVNGKQSTCWKASSNLDSKVLCGYMLGVVIHVYNKRRVYLLPTSFSIMYEFVKGDSNISDILKGKVVYLLVVGNTKTAEVPGITVAGANPELIKYTPPADAELLYYGKCLSIDGVPATPDGKPTPALISYTALRLTGTPFFVVNSGLMVKPKIPFVDIDAPVGGNIAEERAMDIKKVEEAINRARIFGKNVSKVADVLIVGESIPAGTTTAAAVLKALGFEPAVSSSMPENPVNLKKRVVEKAVERVNNDDPIEILSAVGDPVMLGIVGIALGSEKPVVFAGGTQMVAIANLIAKMGEVEAVIVTTKYVASDSNADLSLSPFPVVTADPMLGKSRYEGLRAYDHGFVKEGVGAGGLTLLSYVRGIEPERFLDEVEKDYKCIILNVT